MMGVRHLHLVGPRGLRGNEYAEARPSESAKKRRTTLFGGVDLRCYFLKKPAVEGKNKICVPLSFVGFLKKQEGSLFAVYNKAPGGGGVAKKKTKRELKGGRNGKHEKLEKPRRRAYDVHPKEVGEEIS